MLSEDKGVVCIRGRGSIVEDMTRKLFCKGSGVFYGGQGHVDCECRDSV